MTTIILSITEDLSPDALGKLAEALWGAAQDQGLHPSIFIPQEVSKIGTDGLIYITPPPRHA